MKIEYTEKGGYLIPNLVLKNKNNKTNLGKYGMLKLNYLKQYAKSAYYSLLTTEKLNEYLVKLDKEAKKREEYLINQMAIERKIDENLKETDQMKWIFEMNDIASIAEKIILDEFIYN